jgi:hypothetical protein
MKWVVVAEHDNANNSEKVEYKNQEQQNIGHRAQSLYQPLDYNLELANLTNELQ